MQIFYISFVEVCVCFLVERKVAWQFAACIYAFF